VTAPRWGQDFDTDFPTLDTGIREAVRILRDAGVETFESCQGGPGHAYAEPTVRFYGARSAGWRALWAALDHGLPVVTLSDAPGPLSTVSQ
jgi:hypothetical protein